ncbi:hypothetical protein BHM03_00034602 [Ensete ventricosum]|nr:hypothetical protein BHM03_00034602 [Ensete ventricosum]
MEPMESRREPGEAKPTFAGSYPDHALYKDPDLDEAETRDSLSRESGENGKERASRNPKVFAPLPTL